MTKLVDVLKKLDLVEDKCRRQLEMVVELRRALVAKSLAREKYGRMEQYIAQGQAERRDYDKFLKTLFVDAGDEEVGG